MVARFFRAWVMGLLAPVPASRCAQVGTPCYAVMGECVGTGEYTHAHPHLWGVGETSRRGPTGPRIESPRPQKQGSVARFTFSGVSGQGGQIQRLGAVFYPHVTLNTQG